MIQREERNIHAIQLLTTMQGEGPDVGKRMLLIRFKKCNRVEDKHPCLYCDTLVTMSNTIETEISVSRIQQIIDENNCGLMITGGEPGYGDNFGETIFLLNNLKYPFANVETNGYQLEKFLDNTFKNNVKFIYSPKIFSGIELSKSLSDSEKVFDDPRVYFKIVYENNQLIPKYLDGLKKICGKDTSRIYLMPEGATRDKLIEHSGEVFDACEEYGFNFSTRSHIIYGFI